MTSTLPWASATTSINTEAAWRAVFLDPANPVDRDTLSHLVSTKKVHAIHDTILDQLCDLAAIRHPQRKLTKTETADAVVQLLGSTDPRDYGRWVFYPWSGRLIHLLGREQFQEVRLNRNRNKITAAEQRRLSEITVGVIGLSVGNAVARTLVLEHRCRLKLADFDRLDLSNLNRLQAGVQDLGVNKAVLAARRIYELDPDTVVSIFPEGVSGETLDAFLLGSPRVDILVDECDSLDLKVLLREKARALRIPVLMETSDRGMLDVERFDLEPDRPVFHGLLGSVRASDLRDLPMQEKVVHVLRIIGAATMSTRLAASLVEIERTLGTWPQLASDVALGGASVAAAVRRIALGLPLTSGRRYVDLDRVLTSEPALGVQSESEAPPAFPSLPPPLVQLNSGPSSFLRFLVAHAVLAPSGGNVQPWRFYADGEQLHVVHDRERSRNLLDLTEFASCIALGAAIENIVIAAAHCGLETMIRTFPCPANPAWVATLQFQPDHDGAARARASLFDVLALRVTNRRKSDTRPPSQAEEEALVQAAAQRGAALELHTGQETMTEVGQILGLGDRIRFLCADLHRELMGELRWSTAEADSTRDGIDIATLEMSTSDAAALRVLARPDVAALLREQDGGVALTEGSPKLVDGACAMGLIRARDEDAESFLAAGRAIQRTWLSATRLGFGFQPMTALLFMLRILPRPENRIFLEREREILRMLAKRLDTVFCHRAGQAPAMLFRLTRSTEVTARSLRRPVEDVLCSGRPPG